MITNRDLGIKGDCNSESTLNPCLVLLNFEDCNFVYVEFCSYNIQKQQQNKKDTTLKN